MTERALAPSKRSACLFARPLVWAVVALLALGACSSAAPDNEDPEQTPHAGPIDARHRAASEAAHAWLDRLELDPVALIARGVKGKKKLAEILTAYLSLLRYAPDPSGRPGIEARVREIALQAERPEYHNMLDCDSREFTENSMSYLRAAWLLEQLGQDTRLYRARLAELLPRLELSLPSRSATQRARFAAYYDYFGWPWSLKEPTPRSVVAERLPYARYRQATAYALTHEVSTAFRFGLRRKQSVFDRAGLGYLSRLLPPLVIRFAAVDQPDLVAELVSSMTYLELQDLQAYRQGIEFLLDSQNANGSWGDYEDHRAALAGDLDVKLYLHTTMVALRALLEARDGAWLRSTRARASSNPG